MNNFHPPEIINMFKTPFITMFLTLKKIFTLSPNDDESHSGKEIVISPKGGEALSSK